ncbi:hypothetical protein K2173_008323 [Erythroxylum novogranatense]|uniref:BHLH domain-containing protein n=1 Tax=Erythroxylum novogranatense TaxID=1862640 RepID=A0AAV8U3N5_9ROSI|nr:hypothetical protein K2173_008323 [Erythroxylum novogranatense]
MNSSRDKRNLKERERRTNMKNLLALLASLLPSPDKKLAIPGLLNDATRYLKNLQERIEELKRARNELCEKPYVSCMDSNVKVAGSCSSTSSSPPPPVIDINIWGVGDSTLEVNIVSRSKKFLLHDLVRILQEEGAQVISLVYHDSHNSFIYTLKSKVLYPRIGVETSNLRNRLTELANGATDIDKDSLIRSGFR